MYPDTTTHQNHKTTFLPNFQNIDPTRHHPSNPNQPCDVPESIPKTAVPGKLDKMCEVPLDYQQISFKIDFP